MDKDRARTLMAVAFFFVLLFGFGGAYYLGGPNATFPSFDFVTGESIEDETNESQEDDLTGAAVTKSEEDKVQQYLEKPKNTAVFWTQIVVVFSLLAVYGVYRGGFLSRPKKFSDDSLKKYFQTGLSNGHSIDELKNELARQKVSEAQIEQVLKQIGKL
jgi:hypothetical protein